MTPLASPTSRSCPTRRAPPRRGSCAVLPVGSRKWESRWSECSQTTAPVTDLAATPRRAQSSACATFSPGPTGRAPTARIERFIQTLTNRWAYGAIYGSSAERTAALPGWLDHYNFRRRHGSLGHRPPAARLAELEQPRE